MTATTLAAKLAEATAAISHIPKRGRNQTQGYDFVTDADVLDTVRKQLSERKVATTVGIHSFEHLPFTTAKGSPQFLTTVSGDLTFLDGESGEAISVPFVGVGADAMDKGYYKAVTGGVKYALLKSLLVPTGDDPENDGADPSVKPASATPAGNRDTSKPKAADEKSEVGLSDKQKALLHARFRDLGVTETASKKHILVKLTGKYATKDMTGEDLDTVIAFFKVKSDATEALVLEAMAAA